MSILKRTAEKNPLLMRQNYVIKTKVNNAIHFIKFNLLSLASFNSAAFIISLKIILVNLFYLWENMF